MEDKIKLGLVVQRQGDSDFYTFTLHCKCGNEINGDNIQRATNFKTHLRVYGYCSSCTRTELYGGRSHALTLTVMESAVTITL